MPKVLTIVFLAFYVYVILSSITVILLENRNPAKSLSWILVLIFLPGVGLVLYIAIGQDYRKQKFVDKNTIQHLIDRPVASFDLSRLDTSYMDNNQLNLINLLYRNSGAAGYAFNKIDILSDGAATFGSLFDAIEGARDHIHIEFFIFADDEISNRLRELLIRKARAGVRVRMIYDYWGSFRLSMSARYIRSLKEAGVYVHPFLPLRLRVGRSKINYRNHRKIVVVDGRVGFTGGVNVAETIHGPIGDLYALALERLAGVEHGMVLDGRGDKAYGCARAVEVAEATYRAAEDPGVRFRPTTGEVNLLRRSAKGARYAFTCV